MLRHRRPPISTDPVQSHWRMKFCLRLARDRFSDLEVLLKSPDEALML